MTLEDKDGWNALDIAIVRINYKAARILGKAGLQRRERSDYEGKTWRKFDIEMFFESLDADVEDVPYKRFFDKIKRERAEWLAKDLVVDRRERSRGLASLRSCVRKRSSVAPRSILYGYRDSNPR